MEEDTRKPERAEDALKILSVCVSMVSFWVIALSWNYIFFDDLEFVPRLGLGAALSWVVFLHVEATGMIIMSMMREKWRSEGQEARLYAREARAEAAEARAREAQAEAREAQAEAREAQAQTETAEARARAEAREAQAQAEVAEARAREALAQLEARESEAVIRELRRQLREARGEGANGAEDA